MKRFAIVLLGLTSLVSAKPGFLSVPLTYATPSTDIDGAPDHPGVVRTQRVNERVNQANEAARSTGLPVRETPRGRESFPLAAHDDASPIPRSVAPLGADGRVVDTPEVAAARAAHAAAHVNERLNLANEAVRSGVSNPSKIADNAVVAAETPIGPDGGVLDTSEVAAAHVNERINLVNGAYATDGAVVPLVLGNGVVAALVPIDPDGGPLAARGVPNPTSETKSVDALAIAGSALAYGRLVY